MTMEDNAGQLGRARPRGGLILRSKVKTKMRGKANHKAIKQIPIRTRPRGLPALNPPTIKRAKTAKL